MGKIVRVGIIGLGRSGLGIHGKHLLTVPRHFKIVAAADPMEDRRKRAEDEFTCDTYANWRALLKRDDMDLIVNAGPSRSHVSQSLACLKAGFHVLCEKPLSKKVSEVDELIRVSKKAKREMIVFQSNRFQPAYEQVMKVAKSGIIGRIVMVKTERSNFSRRYDWQTLRKELGGSLLSVGSHNLDEALKFYDDGVMPKVWCDMDRTVTRGDAEDHVKLLLKAPGYPTIDLQVSSCTAYEGPFYNILGTRGGILAGLKWVTWKYFNPKKNTGQKLEKAPISDADGHPIYCKDNIIWKEGSWDFDGESPFDYSVTKSYKGVYNTLTKGAPFAVSMMDMRRLVAVIEESHRQNPPSKMAEPEV